MWDKIKYAEKDSFVRVEISRKENMLPYRKYFLYIAHKLFIQIYVLYVLCAYLRNVYKHCCVVSQVHMRNIWRVLLFTHAFFLPWINSHPFSIVFSNWISNDFIKSTYLREWLSIRCHLVLMSTHRVIVKHRWLESVSTESIERANTFAGQAEMLTYFLEKYI